MANTHINLPLVESSLNDASGNPITSSNPLPVTAISGGGATYDTNLGATGANTLRTSSNIARNGNELSYNDGTSDANTLRVSANIQRDGNDLAYDEGANNGNTIRVSANIARNGNELSYNAGTSDANTIRTSANITRNGTELSYNSAASDANTVRVAANTVAGQSGVQGGSGTVSANTQRVVLATDVALPAGTNSIGSVTQATASNFNAQAVGNVADSAADTGNPIKVGAIFRSTVPALAYDNGDRADLQVDSVGSLYINSSGRKPSYRAATTFTTAGSPTDVLILNGSSTKVIKVRNITITGTNTNNTNVLIDLVKRSTANTGGTSATVTAVPNDSNSAAASAVVTSYTANPTLGTTVGTVGNGHTFFPVLGSTNISQIREFVLFSAISEPIVLRGTAEGLAVNFRGATPGGTTVVAIKIEWTEE